MAHHAPVSLDPNEVKRAHTMWDNFMKMSCRFSIGIAGILIALALIFVR